MNIKMLKRLNLTDGKNLRELLLEPLYILIAAARSFQKDKCPLWASALTFYSVMSIVPVAAMAFGIAKGFGLENMLKTQLVEKFPEQQQVMKFIIDFADTLLHNTSGEMVAGIGVIVLFWSVVRVLENIEMSFNYIWGVSVNRNFIRKMSDYLSMMLICPILVIVSGSITVFVSAQLADIPNKLSLLQAFGPLIYVVIKSLPFVMAWIMFSFIYIIIPNTRVNYKSGIMAGIIAGTMYQLFQMGYIFIQMALSKSNAIYGSFSALPLFLVWMQLNWMLVLFGAEISSVAQNFSIFRIRSEEDRPLSGRSVKILALRIINFIVKNFKDCSTAPTDLEIAAVMKADFRTVKDVLDRCVGTGVLNEIVRNGKGNGAHSYQPAFDIEKMTVRKICDSMDQYGKDIFEKGFPPEYESFRVAVDSSEEPSSIVLPDKKIGDI